MLSEQQVHIRSSTPRHNIERILCPTDLSPDSDEALRYATALAQAYSAKLLVCYCAGRAVSNGCEKVKGLFEESIGPHISLADISKLDCESIVISGEAAKAIVDEAAHQHVDLIVMRSRRRPHAAAVLGSTAESICRNAPCPVLVTHPDEREWVDNSNGKIDLKRVLVAYDFSDYSELALSYALTLAQEYQSELHLLHVLPPRVEKLWSSSSEVAFEINFQKATRRLQYVIPSDAYQWCKISKPVTEGQPYREILSYAEENKIDLICMGAHGTDFGMRALFGSNADRVLRQAPCPVLIARPLKWNNDFA